ncbi:zinc/manganese transport system substrate-binding protein [Leifsonia sp. 98AMF]|uniref:metal ABC transporter solute-binding protein, Zn/Mn family n=1 Tax=unclassified Leifsonia TaxID=2663824 RepID=UPI00087A7B61|nr:MULTISPECIES: zinc ABC transporter substrate-binding protein [unclassified Leifsonia]SDG97648.1 zinc/manganese transport system substrate-binding protein [Leifsonia sp. 197AMF]SDJ43864.1 zinc/manganese transport system substrate-binding protein [Leifsonia sp. 466MF]SDK32681.1 zinc/manganese transport system substrate-binding protein [Leifsonia sp. 157MF]SDN64212.1 zinc/manganese transport system substrate-binding protein [Leifsonia sp. 509MF]SEN44630.1 zinc/manganese transport system substr
MKTRSLVSALTAAAIALTLAGCSSSSSAGSDDSTVRVVASTDVYGDIATTIGGDAVHVTSLMTDPAQDPHSFEASAQNQLAVSKADVVIENGGGYDDYMQNLVKGATNSGVKVLNVVDLSGKKPVDGELNEHVWYDFPTVQKFADALTAALSAADPSQKATFERNASAFGEKLSALEATEAQLKSTYAGEGVAITEPVPLYLLDAIGLVNKTPEKFSEAIEEENDVSPIVLKDTLQLFSGHQVKLLAYNEQTTGAETEKVLAAAKAAGIPVVPVTETLPEGMHYIGWMSGNLDAVKGALAK